MSSTVDNQQQAKSDDPASVTWLSWFYSMFRNLWSMNLWGPTLTLQDCLHAFFQTDELTGDNMYSCEKCGKLRNGIKYCRVLELPEVLCIHLKRFRHDSLIYTKIGTYVSFPLCDLDMKAFLHKECKNTVYTYDLFSCIVHYGRAGAGHYVTYSLNQLTQEWFEFDDDAVRRIDVATVQNADAYVLFYKKKEKPGLTEAYETIRHLLANDQNRLLPFYISRSWINRFFYFAEPGPISNSDFLCKHGGVLPHYWTVINDLVLPAPESVWEFLHEKYGGGPVCNLLYPCRKCQLDEENVKRRQRFEKATYLQLQQAETKEDAVYAISPTWYRDWENFVMEKSSEPPGPISNNGIAATKNGFSRLRRDCNHRQLSEKKWNFLLSTYGGGPELLIRVNSSMTPSSSPRPSTSTCDELSPFDSSLSSITSSNKSPPVTFV